MMGNSFFITSFLYLLVFIHCAQLPPWIEVCHYSDPKLEDCIARNVEILRPKFAEGVPELLIPSLNPLLISEASLQNVGDFKATFTDIKVYHAAEFVLKRMRVDLPHRFIDIGLEFPRLRIVSTYKFGGHILALQLDGSGPADGNFTNVLADFKVNGELIEKNGKQFFHFKSSNIKLNVGKPKFLFEGIFKNNDELNERTNQLINENIGDILEELTPVVKEVTSNIVVTLVSRIFDKYSFDELFPSN